MATSPVPYPQSGGEPPEAEGIFGAGISVKTFGDVKFDNARISIWQDVNDEGRFYVMPLLQLDHQTIQFRENELTGVVELIFKVIMYSEETEEAVRRYIIDKDFRGDTTYLDVVQVGVVPMQKIRLVWGGQPISSELGIHLEEKWQTSTNLAREYTFRLLCTDADRCRQFRDLMKEKPEIFDGLVFQYVITASKTARRRITINTSAISQSDMFSKLENMPDATGDIRYLSAKDVNNVVAQSLETVVASQITDGNYVNSGDEVKMADLLKTTLQNQREDVKSLDDIRWESVFWDPIFMRPDKVVNELNHKYTKDEDNSDNLKITDEYKKDAGGGSVEASGNIVGLGSASTKVTGWGSSENKEREELRVIESQLRERDAKVEWNGEKFAVKPMSVSRVNLAELRTASSIGVVNAQVNSYETVHEIPVKVGKMASPTSVLSPQLVEERLLEKFDELEVQNLQRGYG